VSGDNVELVRRIYSAWKRGDFSATWWCADDFEFQVSDGPVRDIGDERVLGVNAFGGEGRTSGLAPESLGATIWTISDGKVTRLAACVHLDNALRDVGLEE
jgi:ketosteroid isomerase-like protein